MKITEKTIKICGHGSGTPRVTDLYSYAENRYQQLAPNGVHKGIVAVKRLKGMTAFKRRKFRDLYTTILGRNKYSQTLRGCVYFKYADGHYYSDCSSSGMATFKKLGFKFDWLYNTASIYTEKEFKDVPVIIENGHILNPEILKVGDCILFVGNDPSRPKQIGHVEYVYKRS